jgi:hypothetical protein
MIRYDQPVFFKQPSLRLRESCVPQRFSGAKALLEPSPDLNYRSAVQVTGGVCGIEYSIPTPQSKGRKRFNPHRARSGSVQRILSAPAPGGVSFIPQDLPPQHCG